MFPHMSYECFRHTVDSRRDTGLLYTHKLAHSVHVYLRLSGSRVLTAVVKICVFLTSM